MESTTAQFTIMYVYIYIYVWVGALPQILTVSKEGRESLVYMSLISTFGKQRQFQKKPPLYSEFQDSQCYIDRFCQEK